MTIRELRDKLDMTQHDLAFEIGATIRTVARWEGEGMDIGDKHINRAFRMNLQRLARRVKQ